MGKGKLKKRSRIRRRARKEQLLGPEREVEYIFEKEGVLYEHLTCNHEIIHREIMNGPAKGKLRRRCEQCKRKVKVTISIAAVEKITWENGTGSELARLTNYLIRCRM